MKGVLGILLIGSGLVVAYLILSGKFGTASSSATTSTTANTTTTGTNNPVVTQMSTAVNVGYPVKGTTV